MKNDKNIKKCWVIERSYGKDKKLLAILDARTNTEKIMSAMKILMMSECDNVKGMLSIQKMTMKNSPYDHPHMPDINYPIVIGFGSMYWKAPYKAWITRLNTDTGEYVDIDTMHLEY